MKELIIDDIEDMPLIIIKDTQYSVHLNLTLDVDKNISSFCVDLYNDNDGKYITTPECGDWK